MTGSSNSSSSFIPKRGPARHRKPKTKNQIFLFSIITYSLLFAALLAAAGTFLYKNYLKSQLQNEVEALNTAVITFSNEDLSRVSEFDVTLKRVTERVNNAASIVSILDGIDAATVEPVQMEGLVVEREGDVGYVISGSIITSSFDAAMFQRKVYNANRKLFSAVDVKEVNISRNLVDSSEEDISSPQSVLSGSEQEVTFSVELGIDLEEVLYDPAEARLVDDVSVELQQELPVNASSTEEADVAEVTDGNSV